MDNSDALRPKVVLAVAAHPDDIEYCIGGSLAGHAYSEGFLRINIH